MTPARHAADPERTLIGFSVLLLMASLLLQRFGVTVGASYFSIVGPIGLGLAIYQFYQGRLAFDTRRLMILVALIGWAALGSAIRAALPDRYGSPTSWMSALQFIGLTAFGTLVFSQPVDEGRFFRAINGCFLFIAVVAMAQFLLQFIGLGLFSFQSFVPPAFLLEGPYNTVIPLEGGQYFKSNGFFLVEPSVLSQYMAFAIIVEMLLFRRTRYLALFGGALVCSLSGTGWLMIFSFVVTAVLSMGGRGVLMAVATVVVGAFAFGMLALLYPPGYDLFVARSNEFSAVGSSGHLRFITPWWLGQYVLDRTPWAALYGLGAGVSEHLGMRPIWDYNLNPPVKITLEYGAPAFILYMALLLTAQRTRVQTALLAPSLVLLLLNGGYQQFPPVLFPAMLIILLAYLRPMVVPTRHATA